MVEKGVKAFGETLALLIERLVGKGSDIELSFKDLTVEVAGLKAKLTGSVVLDISYMREAK